MALATEFGPDTTLEHLSHYCNNRQLRATVRPPNARHAGWIAMFASAIRDDRVGTFVGRGNSMWAALNQAAASYDNKEVS